MDKQLTLNDFNNLPKVTPNYFEFNLKIRTKLQSPITFRVQTEIKIGAHEPMRYKYKLYSTDEVENSSLNHYAFCQLKEDRLVGSFIMMPPVEGRYFLKVRCTVRETQVRLDGKHETCKKKCPSLTFKRSTQLLAARQTNRSSDRSIKRTVRQEKALITTLKSHFVHSICLFPFRLPNDDSGLHKAGARNAGRLDRLEQPPLRGHLSHRMQQGTQIHRTFSTE